MKDLAFLNLLASCAEQWLYPPYHPPHWYIRREEVRGGKGREKEEEGREEGLRKVGEEWRGKKELKKEAVLRRQR